MPLMSLHHNLRHPLPKDRGEIQLIIGPMFSGKSTELMRRLKRCQIAVFRCLLIKYEKDDRYSSDMFSTHDGQKLKAIKCSHLNSIQAACEQYDVIAIDEGQFFPDIVEFAENNANAGRTVIISALDGTFQRKPFPQIMELIPLSETVQKLSAVCMNCRSDAAFSRRLGTETKVEIIGGKDKYMSVCRSCYSLPDIQSPHKLQSRKIPLNYNFDQNLEPKRKLFKEGDDIPPKKHITNP